MNDTCLMCLELLKGNCRGQDYFTFEDEVCPGFDYDNPFMECEDYIYEKGMNFCDKNVPEQSDIMIIDEHGISNFNDWYINYLVEVICVDNEVELPCPGELAQEHYDKWYGRRQKKHKL